MRDCLTMGSMTQWWRGNEIVLVFPCWNPIIIFLTAKVLHSRVWGKVRLCSLGLVAIAFHPKSGDCRN